MYILLLHEPSQKPWEVIINAMVPVINLVFEGILPCLSQTAHNLYNQDSNPGFPCSKFYALSHYSSLSFFLVMNTILYVLSQFI